MQLIALLIALGVSGLVGALCGRTRGKERLGALAGIFLGPIGWVVILLAYPAVNQVSAERRAKPPSFRSPEQVRKEAEWQKAVRGN